MRQLDTWQLAAGVKRPYESGLDQTAKIIGYLVLGVGGFVAMTCGPVLAMAAAIWAWRIIFG
jgi:hypothetical protein